MQEPGVADENLTVRIKYTSVPFAQNNNNISHKSRGGFKELLETRLYRWEVAQIYPGRASLLRNASKGASEGK